MRKEKPATIATIVFGKEFKSFVRDKRAFLNIIVIPFILVPMLLFVGDMAMEDQERLAEDLIIAVRKNDSEFVDFLGAQEEISVTLIDCEKNIVDELISGRIDLALWLENMDKSEALREHIEIQYSGLTLRSMLALAVVEELGAAYNKVMNQRQIAAYDHTNKVVLDPLEFTISDMSHNEPLDLAVLMLVPMLLILSVTIGASNISSPITVGEKETFTLEPLLSTGTPFRGIVLGKLTMIVFAGGLAGITSILGLIFYVILFSPSSDNINLSSLMYIISVVFTIAVFYASVFIVVGFLSRTYRESQAYATVITIASMVPTYFFSTTNTATMPDWYWIVPILNFTLAIRDGLGGVFNTVGILGCIAVAIGAMCIAFFVVLNFGENEKLLHQK